MKRYILFSLAGLLISTLAYCSERETPYLEKKTTANVYGVVVDKGSGESLAGVAISFSGTDQIVYTDLEGQFKIKDIVVPGEYELKADYISYKQTYSKVKLDPESESIIQLELETL